MIPQDLKLIGDLTEQQFLSLMVRDEKDKTPGITGRIHGINEKAREQIKYDYLMAPDKLKIRNVLLLGYFIQNIPSQRDPQLQHSFERVYAAFSKYFQGHKSDFDPQQISSLLKNAREKLGLALHEDDFEIVDQPKPEKETKREGSPTKSPPSPTPQTYNPLSLSNLYTTAIGATTTFVTQKFGSRDSEAQAEFEKNKKNILPEFIAPIDHLLTPGTFLHSSDVKSIFRLFKQLYNADKATFDVVEECLDTNTALKQDPANAVFKRMESYKNQEAVRPSRFMFIPFPYPAHIVMIAVDFQNKTVMYYDPQGLSSSQRNDYPYLNMQDQLHQIKSWCFENDPAAKVVEGKSVHQEGDKHNCGVYVSHFSENLLDGISFEDNQKQVIPRNTIEGHRINYAKQLIRFRQDYLGPDQVNVVLKRFETLYNSESKEKSVDAAKVIEPALLIKTVTEHLKSYMAQKKPRYLFIPVNENGHLVLIAINFQNKKVLFFDPKGDNTETELLPSLDEIKGLCFDNARSEVLQNRFDQQENRNDCGTYILNFVEQLLKGKSFQIIDENPMYTHSTNPQITQIIDARIRYKKLAELPKF